MSKLNYYPVHIKECLCNFAKKTHHLIFFSLFVIVQLLNRNNIIHKNLGGKLNITEQIFVIDRDFNNFVEYDFAIWGKNCENKFRENLFRENSCPKRTRKTAFTKNANVSEAKTSVFHCMKVSVFGVFLVRIFSHSNWMRRDIGYVSAFMPIAGKYLQEKLRIPIFFTQCFIYYKWQFHDSYTWIFSKKNFLIQSPI